MKPFSILTLFIIVLSGCAFPFSHQEDGPQTPRENAAWQLTQEGKQHLSAGNPDNAIRLFEQAIGLNPNYGQCYYYIAQAWLAKGVASEAKKFNHLAQDYLKDDAQWTDSLDQQAYQIERLSK